MNDEIEVEGGESQVVSASSLAILTKAEIDTQIATAKAFPRSLKLYRDTALSMATLDEETAASCLYSLPRADKRIEGGSIRLAEIIASAWQNLRFGARMIGDDGKMITAQGYCHDLQTNNRCDMEVLRRVTTKKGARYNDDMIVVTANAANSLALRNAIFRIVPKAYWQPILNAARGVAVGTQATIVARREKAIQAWAKMGIGTDKLLVYLEKKGVEDIDVDDLGSLFGLYTAIRDNQVNIDEAFAPKQSATDRVKEKVAAKNGGNDGTAPAATGGVQGTSAGQATQTPTATPPAAQAPPQAATEDDLAHSSLITRIKTEASDKDIPMKELLAPYNLRRPEKLTTAQAESVIAYLATCRMPGDERDGNDNSLTAGLD